MHARVLQLELLDDVGDPALAEALPGEHVDAARAEQRPQRHLDGAGVGGRHDADAVVGRHFEHLARQIDRAFELGLAGLGAVRAPERSVFEGFERSSRGAWRRGRTKNAALAGRAAGAVLVMSSILPDGRPSLGRGVPPLAIWDNGGGVKNGE